MPTSTVMRRRGARLVTPLIALMTLVTVSAACVTFLREVEIYDALLRNDEGTVIELSVGSCGARHRIEVEESETRVEVSVLAGKDSAGDDCSDGVEVMLDAPLGDRVLIDASTGEEVEVVD